jgi:diguanylate cyclase (GGDEF)-like protein/PAS domain S-box-containing protein
MLHRPRHWTEAEVGQLEVVSQMLVQASTRCRQRGATLLADVRARRIAEYIPDGLLLTTTEGLVTWASPSLGRMAGVETHRLAGRPVGSLFHPADHAALEERMARAVHGEEGMLTAQMRGADGQWRWTDLALRLASEPESGAADEIVVTLRDNHERHLGALQLADRSRRDALTGVFNGAALEEVLVRLARDDRAVVVAFCDVDDFKSVNDRFGHDVGDAVLRDIARGLERAVRDFDVVARIGGDEFIVLVPGASSNEEADRLGARLVHAVDGVRETHPYISLSVGVCGPGPASVAAAMRRIADQAMYAAKRAGKNGWVRLDVPIADAPQG